MNRAFAGYMQVSAEAPASKNEGCTLATHSGFGYSLSLLMKKKSDQSLNNDSST